MDKEENKSLVIRGGNWSEESANKMKNKEIGKMLSYLSEDRDLQIYKNLLELMKLLFVHMNLWFVQTTKLCFSFVTIETPLIKLSDYSHHTEA